MKFLNALLLSSIALLLLACPVQQQALKTAVIREESCTDIDLNAEKVKTIQVIIHVYNRSDGTGNFQDQPEDIKWLKDKIFDANYILSHLEKPIPQVGDYYVDSKIRLNLLDIKFWNNDTSFATYSHGAYDHRDLYRDQILNNPELSKFEKENCLHILLSGYKPRAYGGRNICMQDDCSDAFGFQNNVIYIEGMHYVYRRVFDYWGIPGHIVHELGHGLGLAHYERSYGSCANCEGTQPCPPKGCNNAMLSNDGGKAFTERQLKIMHHLLKYGPLDSLSLNPNAKAHLLCLPVPESEMQNHQPTE